MDDLKMYMELDEQKINLALMNEDKLKKLCCKSTNPIDVDYWKEKFKYNQERCALQNFWLYKTAGKFNLYRDDMNDADITVPALRELKNKLETIACVKTVEVGKAISASEKVRTFHVYLNNGKDIFLESDTANSLGGDLTKFIRMILRRKYGKNWPNITYIKDFNLDLDKRDFYYEPFRNYYFYTIIPKLKEFINNITDSKDRDIFIKCFEQLEERAKLTHTLKNMILVPYGYNSPRGFNLSTYQSHKKIGDRLDLTIKDFEEMAKDNDENVENKRRWTIKSEARRKNFTAYSVKFLLDNQEKLFPHIPQYTVVAEKNDINGILERTIKIIETLK